MLKKNGKEGEIKRNEGKKGKEKGGRKNNELRKEGRTERNMR